MLERETFIPLRCRDLVDCILGEEHLVAEDADHFRHFADLLGKYVHHEFHDCLERLKDRFAYFDPDNPVRTDANFDELARQAASLAEELRELLAHANYHRLGASAVEAALTENSLFELHTEVNLDDFSELVVFGRGARRTAVAEKHWYFWERTREIEVYDRVAIMLRFREREYFTERGLDPDKLGFHPGKVYIYVYKNIPRYDLELLFPNIRVRMTNRDRLLFAVPALGAAVPAIVKALPQILIVIGAVLFFLSGPDAARQLGADEEEVRNIMPVLAALLSVGMVLGGFAVKQYLNYKAKRLRFLKSVTDTLFFRNLATNRSALTLVVDLAEEEHLKEMLLAYHELLAHGPMTPVELDRRLEQWLEKQLGHAVDFDLHDPLGDLERLQWDGKAILVREGGKVGVVPLEDASRIIDGLWDSATRLHESVRA